jgi:Ca2+-binding RTX toxin-like protein
VEGDGSLFASASNGHDGTGRHGELNSMPTYQGDISFGWNWQFLTHEYDGSLYLHISGTIDKTRTGGQKITYDPIEVTFSSDDFLNGEWLVSDFFSGTVQPDYDKQNYLEFPIYLADYSGEGLRTGDFILGVVPSPFHINFNGVWNARQGEIRGTVSFGDFDHIAQTSDFVLTVKGIRDEDPPDHHCIYDLNGDGKITIKNPAVSRQEKDYSDCAHRLEVAQGKLDKLSELLPGIKDLIDDLKSSVNDIDLSQLISIIGHATKGILNFCGGLGEAASLTWTAVASIHAVFIEHKSIGSVALDAWSDLLGVFTKTLKASKLVSQATGELLNEGAGLIDTANEAKNITDQSEASAILDTLIPQIIKWEGTLGTIKLQMDLWKAERDAALECVNHANARPSAKLPPRDSGISDNYRQGILIDTTAHALEALSAKASHASGLGKTIVVPDLFAQHDASMPDGLNIGVGQRTNDIFHAVGDDLQGDASLCLLAPDLGNDRILVSAGSLIIVDKGGADSVLVYDSAGDLASINDITASQVDNPKTESVTFWVGLNLFLQTQGIDKFTFAEGTYHLVNGELQFQAGEENILVIRGTRYNDTITGGSLADQLLGLAGNDKLNGGAGDDILIGGAGRDALIGGTGDDTLIGGTGNDSFQFLALPFGKDIIEDFQEGVGPGDVIKLSVTVFADFAAVQAASVQVGDDMVITKDASNTVTLRDVLLSNLAADDFAFV